MNELPINLATLPTKQDVPREIVDLMLKALSTASEVGEIKFRTCYLSKGANEEIEEALTAYRSWLSSQQGQGKI